MSTLPWPYGWYLAEADACIEFAQKYGSGEERQEYLRLAIKWLRRAVDELREELSNAA